MSMMSEFLIRFNWHQKQILVMYESDERCHPSIDLRNRNNRLIHKTDNSGAQFCVLNLHTAWYVYWKFAEEKNSRTLSHHRSAGHIDEALSTANCILSSHHVFQSTRSKLNYGFGIFAGSRISFCCISILFQSTTQECCYRSERSRGSHASI